MSQLLEKQEAHLWWPFHTAFTHGALFHAVETSPAFTHGSDLTFNSSYLDFTYHNIYKHVRESEADGERREREKEKDRDRERERCIQGLAQPVLIFLYLPWA